jgi:hypothetical protein
MKTFTANSLFAEEQSSAHLSPEYGMARWVTTHTTVRKTFAVHSKESMLICTVVWQTQIRLEYIQNLQLAKHVLSKLEVHKFTGNEVGTCRPPNKDFPKTHRGCASSPVGKRCVLEPNLLCGLANLLPIVLAFGALVFLSLHGSR